MYLCMYVFISSPEELIFSLVLEKRRETPAGGGTRNLGTYPGPGPGSNRDLVALGMPLHAAESPGMIFFFFFFKGRQTATGTTLFACVRILEA